ncbi:transferase [Bacteroides caecigallinarum]|uniref:PglD-related sugar-binding protein n=1 Tax=Bacteroides caecigallinarum TaxID=1411144 RepID=UPI001F3C1812|nr:transferase [Bacteroides caecigallinarum]MCF2738734.1 transferase [Bacteroides caecigallinarum]
MKDIYVLGVGHNTIVCIDLVETCGFHVAGLYHFDDSRTGEKYFDYPIIGSFTDLYSKGDLSNMYFVLSQGDNKIRKTVFENIKGLNGNFPSLIHPTAVVSKYSIIGEGVIVHANAVIDPDTKIGNDSVISFNAGICHSSSLGAHCYISPGAIVGAYTKIEDSVFVGLQATIISGKVKVIAEDSIIGASALVNKSVLEKSIMIGNPARKYEANKK